MATDNNSRSAQTHTAQNEQLKRIGKELFPILSGIFFGYNIALIAGDVLGIFSSENYWEEASIYGALVGCLLVFLLGYFGNFKARIEILKVGVSISLLSSFFGGVIFLINHQFNDMFNIIRFFIGVTVGLSCVAPVYLVEEKPNRKRRGNYFSWYQLAITIGILIAYMVMYFLVFFNIGKYYHVVSLFVCTILSMAYFFTLTKAETSNFERWTNEHKDFNKKKQGIHDFFLKQEYEKESGENSSSFEHDRKILLEEPRLIRKTPYHKVFITPFIIGIAIIAIQQAVGINVVIYKFSELLPLFGVDNLEGKLLFMLIIGLVNALSTIPGMLMIDTVGRRDLFLIGMSGIILSLSVLTFLMANVKPVYEIIPDKFYVEESSIKCNSIDEYLKNDTLRLSDQILPSSTGTKNIYNKDFFEEKIALPNETKILYITTENDSKTKRIIYSKFKDELENKGELKGDKITFAFCLENKVLKLDSIEDGTGKWISIKSIDCKDCKEITKSYHPALKYMFGEDNDYGLLFFITLIVIYIIFFASTLGILGWLVPAEIIPIKIRSQGMAIIAATHWFINLLIVTLFTIKMATAFFVTFTIISIIALVLGFYYFPETNSKRLKYIDYFWRGKGNIDDFNNDAKFIKKAIEVEAEWKKYKDKINKFYKENKDKIEKIDKK